MKMISASLSRIAVLSVLFLAPFCEADLEQRIVNVEPAITLPTCCPLDLSGTGKCQNTKSIENKTYYWEIPGHLMSTKSSMQFRFQYRVSDCNNGGSTNLLLLEHQPNKTLVDYFLPNGYLKIGTDYYPPQEYCINGTTGNTTKINLVLKVCKPNCGPRTPCIKKCCPPDKLYSMGFTPRSQKSCIDRGPHDQYMPNLYHNYDLKFSDKESKSVHPHFYESSPKSFQNCESKPMFTPYGQKVAEAFHFYRNIQPSWKHFRLTNDGYMMYRKSTRGRCLKLNVMESNICFDGVINYSENVTTYRNEEVDTLYFYCVEKSAQSTDSKTSKFYGPLLLTTSIFALLTILVYILLWKRQNFRGWIILSQATSLFFTNIFLGTGHIIRSNYYRDILDTPGCIFLGYATHFFFLSMFCWISVTGFDLWFTFRELKPTSSQSEGRRRLIAYSCFAWGLPTLFVLVGGILQNIADDTNCGDRDMNSALVIPGYGIENCYLSEQALGTYLYYPATAMMVITILFFCVTIFKFYKYRTSTRMATKDESLKQFYMLSLKLFIVMGVTWVFEIISFFLDSVNETWHWFVFDVLNCIRPVAFFAIFVCKPDIIAALRDNYAILKPILEPCSKAFPKKSLRSDSENATMTTGMSTKRSVNSDSVRHNVLN